MLVLDAPSRIVSVGYEGQTNSQLVDRLSASRVTCVIDVRLNPISRKAGLSKTKLAESLARVGIAYYHLRALGNPKDNRDAFRQGQDAALRRFEDHIQSEGAQKALDFVKDLAASETIALLCFEKEHESCHRHVVAEALIDRLPQLQLNVVSIHN